MENEELFNIDLLILNQEQLKMMGEVKSLSIFEPSTQVFASEGLFSTEIFGPVGSDLRNNKFGYVNLGGIEVLHPLVYKQLVSLKSLYKDVINGYKYAVFDSEINDLVISNPEEGKTGYNFMLSVIDKLELTNPNNSDQREFKIKLIEKYIDPKTRIKNWLVLPAGLRDYTIDKKGVPSEDEVNDLYRKLITTVNNISNISITKDNIELIDSVRLKIQNTLLDLYLHFETLLKGKNKFISGKWSKRAIMNGTRNVITPFIHNPSSIEENNVTLDHTILGLYQFIKAIAPITMNKVHNMFVNRIFNPDTTTALLVNKKTLESELIDLPIKKRDEWLSIDGLNNIMNKLAQDDIRATPVEVNGYYFMLIYDDGKNLELIPNTEYVRDDLNKKYIRPITYAELFYISIYDVKDKYPGFLTRYPVANLGSVYPTLLYVKTTFNARTVKITIDGISKTMSEYPILTESFVSSMSPHITRLDRLAADFDGDMCSLNVDMTEESVKEINDYFQSKEAYLTPNGDITYSVDNDVLSYALKHLTMKGPEEVSKLSKEDKDVELSEMDKAIKGLKPIYKLRSNLKDWYYASKDGTVYKIFEKKDGSVSKNEMKPFTTKDGYLEYVLTLEDGKKVHLQGQRIIASTFLGMPKDSTLEVNHNDGNRKNNAVSNLKWMTKSENALHSYRELGKVPHNKKV